MLFAETTLQGLADKAEGVSPWWFIAAAVFAACGLAFWNWAKVKAAFTAALPDPVELVSTNNIGTVADLTANQVAIAALDQIGALKNGFALLLELDRYSPKSMSAEERDALLLDGVERLLKARSEARK
jgi:hypothetical protein